MIEWLALRLARLFGSSNPQRGFAGCLDNLIHERDRLTLRLSTVERSVGFCTDSVSESNSQEY